MSKPAHTNAEIVVNDQGGAQSKLAGCPKLIPPEALLSLSQVVALGAERYAENNWRKISMADHVSHALEHLFLHMNGDKEDDHLDHALCRLAMAVAMRDTEYSYKTWKPLPEKEKPVEEKPIEEKAYPIGARVRRTNGLGWPGTVVSRSVSDSYTVLWDDGIEYPGYSFKELWPVPIGSGIHK